MPEFIFATCQLGAEVAFKAELARDRPDLRLAYSRPGFLTFKLPADGSASEKAECPLSSSVFARASGFSLGKLAGDAIGELAAGVWRLAGERPFRRLHVWRRDLVGSDFRGKVHEPSPTVGEVEQAILSTIPTAACPAGRICARGSRRAPAISCSIASSSSRASGGSDSTARGASSVVGPADNS